MERAQKLRELLAKYSPQEVADMLEAKELSSEIPPNHPLVQEISARLNEYFQKAASSGIESAFVSAYSVLDWNETRMSRVFRRETPKAELIRQLADQLVQTDLSHRPEFLGRLVPAKEQTADHASAEWDAVAAAATAYGLWASLNSKVKVFPVLGAYQDVFVTRLSGARREFFTEIVSSRQEDYVKRISAALETKDNAQALKSAGRMASRIMGYYADEEIDELAGSPVFVRADPITATALWCLVIDLIIATKRYIDKLQAEVPALFSVPHEGSIEE